MHRLFPSVVVIAAIGALSFSHASGNVNIIQSHIPIVPDPLPPPNPATNSDKIVQLFKTLGRTTQWDLVQKVPFEGDTGEPEGMVVIGNGERFIIGAGIYTVPTLSFGNGTIINGTDRTPGAGIAHLFVFDSKGTRIADAELSPPGALEYHIGGIEYSVNGIWATIAQYRPNTTAHIVHIDPQTLEAKTVFHANDHYGGIVDNVLENKLVTLNWGSRNASTWRQKPRNPNAVAIPDLVQRNPSYWIDYQDCKFLGHPEEYNRRAVMMCSGVATLGKTTIGGVAIVDTETMVALAEVWIPMLSDLGSPVTQNAMDVSVVDGRLRFYFCPDQHNATLYTYDANPNSPFEF